MREEYLKTTCFPLHPVGIRTFGRGGQFHVLIGLQGKEAHDACGVDPLSAAFQNQIRIEDRSSFTSMAASRPCNPPHVGSFNRALQTNESVLSTTVSVGFEPEISGFRSKATIPRQRMGIAGELVWG